MFLNFIQFQFTIFQLSIVTPFSILLAWVTIELGYIFEFYVSLEVVKPWEFLKIFFKLYSFGLFQISGIYNFDLLLLTLADTCPG